MNPAYALVSCMDSMFLLRRDLSVLLSSEASKQKVYGDKGPRELGSLSDLNTNAILDRGAVVGLVGIRSCERLPSPGSRSPAPDKAMRECISRTETYIRDQLGDARSFSLDSPKSRAPRIEAIRRARKHK